MFRKIWYWITASRYDQGFTDGKAKGRQIGKAMGRVDEQLYMIEFLEHKLKEFAEPLNDDGVRLGFYSAIQELKALR